MEQLIKNNLDTFFGGVNPSQDANVAGKAIGANEDVSNAEVPFGNLLTSLLGRESNVIDPSKEFNMLNLQTLEADVQVEDGKILSGKIIASSKVVDELGLTGKLLIKNSSELNLPINNSYQNSVKELFNFEPIKLDAGKYKVLDQNVSGETLNLSVTAEDNPEKIIKLSIPANLLKNFSGNNVATENINRTNLIVDETLESNFNRLLEKLNVKSIEIVQEETQIDSQKKSNTTQSSKISLNIVVEQSGEAKILKRKIDGNEIKAFQKREELFIVNSTRPTNAISSEKNDEFRLFPEGQATKSNLNQKFNLGSEISQTDKNWSIEANAESKLSSLDNSVDKSTLLDSKVDVRSARFVLPENLKSQLATRSRSVIIKLDPENLGPAKLKLTMINEVLTARLIVENVFVKAIVENSLEKLIDQLAKADIKVDGIEVAVESGSAEENMFGQNNHWKNKLQYDNQNNKNQNRNSRQDTKAEPIIQRVGQALSMYSSGLNILA